jgi:hypothetical protein
VQQEKFLRGKYAELKKANQTQHYDVLAKQLKKEAKKKQTLWRATQGILDREYEVEVDLLDMEGKEDIHKLSVSGFDLRLDKFDVQKAYEIRVTKLKIFVQVDQSIHINTESMICMQGGP